MRALGTFNSLIAFFLVIFVYHSAAFAGPGRTTYQAKIIKPDGFPLEASSVNFKFTILDPNGSCILYSEIYSGINMNSSGGLVSFSLGAGLKTFPLNATTFEQVFSNVTPSLACAAGGFASYSPLSTDTRKVIVQFNDGNGWQTLPAMNINAVPYAMFANESQRLQGLGASDFVQVSTLASCGVSEALRFDGAGFSCVTVGAVTSSSSSGGVSYTVVSPLALSGTQISLAQNGATSGQVLRWTGSQWAPATIVVTSNDISTALGYAPTSSGSYTTVVSSVTTLASSFATLANQISNLGSLAYANSIDLSSASATGIISEARLMNISGMVSGAQYTKVTVDGKGRVISGSQISATEINSTLAVPSCGVNQFLSFNGTTYSCGTDAGASGTITSVTATGALSSTAGTNPVISLNFNSDFTLSGGDLSLTTTGAVPGTYVKMTIDSKGRVVSSSALTANDVISALGYSPLQSGTVTSSQWITNGTSISYESGKVGIGTSSPMGTLHLVDESNGVLFIDNYNSSAGNNPAIIGRKASGTVSSPAATLAAQKLMFIGGRGYDGSTFSSTSRANISMAASENWSTVSQGAQIVFATSQNGTSSAINRAIIANDGKIGFGTMAPAAELDVSGTLRVNQICDRTGANCHVVSSGWPLGGGTVSASANNSGYLTAADWNLFNSKLSTLDLSSASATGTLSHLRLPAFTGDVSSVSGSSVLALSNSGVASGTYTKVTVDAKGRVLNGTNFTSADIISALGYAPVSATAFASGAVKVAESRTTTAQSIAHATFTVATNLTSNFDTAGFFLAGAPNRLTIPAGISYVRVTGFMAWAINATGLRHIAIYKNGSIVYNGVIGGSVMTSVVAVYEGLGRGQVTSPPIPVVQGDYFQVAVYQTSGAALNLTDAGISIEAIDGGSSSSTLANSSLFASGSNIGIGTTSPNSALDVSGTIRASQICDRNGNNCHTISSGWGAGSNSGTPVAFSVYKNGVGQTTGSNVITTLSWNAELFDTNNNFASNRFTPTVSGTYVINGAVQYTGAGATYVTVVLIKNGGFYQTATCDASGSNRGCTISVVVQMNGTTDYLELAGSSNDTSVSGISSSTYFSGALISSSGGSGGSLTQVTAVAPLLVSGTSSPQVSIATGGSVSGQTLRFDGSAWQRSKLLYTDLVNNISASPWPASSCSAGQAVVWNSATDSFSCGDIQILAARIPATNLASNVSGGVTGVLPVPNGGTGATSFTANRIVLGNGVSALTSLSAGVSGAVLSSNGAGLPPSWVTLDQLTSGANNSMFSGWPDAIVCSDGSNARVGYYTLSSAGITTYRAIMNNSNDLFVQYNSSGAYSANSAMGSYDCATNAWSITQLKNLGKTFNFAKGPAGQWLASGTSTYLNTGYVGIGTNAPMTPLSVTTPISGAALHPFRAGIQASGEGTDVTGRVSARVAGSFETPLFTTYKSLGTLASPTAVTANQQIAGLVGFAYNGDDYIGGGNASVSFWSTQNQTVSAAGARISFSTTNDNTIGATEKMVISHNGNVGIGTSSPQATLEVSGTIRLAKNSAQPSVCSATNDGTMAMTSGYVTCVCKSGVGWVQTSDGATTCNWTSSGGSGLGVAQTWQNVSASRAFATTYTNSTSKPIFVSISTYQPTSAGGNVFHSINGVEQSHLGVGINNGKTVTFIVPPGGTYSARTDSTYTISSWFELR